MKNLKLALWILTTLFRSGILPTRIDHWLKIVTSFWRCGPSFAFLGELAALRFGSYEALTDDEVTLTFSELRDQAEALARFLRTEDGLKPAERVAIIFSNHRGFALSLLALTRLGADVLPVNPRLPRSALSDILKRQRIDFVLHEPQVAGLIDPQVRSRQWADGLDAPEELPRVHRAGQLIVLTSGSTGVSKGIVRRPTLAEVLPVTAGLLRDLPIELNRPVLLAIPLYHGYGIATLAMGLALGCPLSTGKRYDIETLMARRVRPEPALLVTVPTLLWRWVQSSGDKPNLAAVITGSAPLSAHLSRRLLDQLGPVIYNLYGATETGIIALATPDMLEAAPGCVGLPLPGNEVRIAGDEVGEISIRGPLVLGASDDGWLETGDIGRRDEHGYLHICGRQDGMIVSGGENIYPHELSDILVEYPHLQDFSVLALDDEEFGKILVAAVVLKDSITVSTEEIKEWLKKRLEHSKLPRQIFVLDSLPRNELGKIRQRELISLLHNV